MKLEDLRKVYTPMDARANKNKKINHSNEDVRIRQKRKFESRSNFTGFANSEEIDEISESTDASKANNGAHKLVRKQKNKKEEHTGKSVGEGGGKGYEDGKKKVAGSDGGSESVEDSIEDGGVVVSGKNIDELKYAALRSFDSLQIPAELLGCCKNFTKPSPIQSHSWPFLLNGRDFIGIAATGSGKTLAFGIPAIMHVLNKRKSERLVKSNPLCLVLSPTRELAQQIFRVLCNAGKPSAVRTVCIHGGTSKQPQISSLKLGVDIVICTPGRLKDLIEMGICCLKDISFVVLDEADRMLDMGFEQEVRFILNQTCVARQMAMFSATWPQPVNLLSQEFMDADPVKVVIGSENLTANHDVMQIVEVLDDGSRNKRLVALLEKYHSSRRNRVLVFVLYKKEASRVEYMLSGMGWNVVSIHGDKAQVARTESLNFFRNGSCPLLIATDVAARGLDIPDVEVVINYSFPLTTEDYVHRIGRTGRAGKRGVSHTFFMHENKGLAGELVNVLREAGQFVPEELLKFGTHVKKKESKLYGSHFREILSDAPKATKIKFHDSEED